MKKLITYLKTLWRRGLDSQSSEVGFDRRLTVGSPSGLDAKWEQNPFMRFAVVLTLIFTLGVGNVWGADTFETSTFTDKYGNVGDDEPEWSCPTGENGFDATYGIMYSTAASSGRTVSLTSDAFDGKKIKSVSVVVRRNKSYAITLAVTVGSTTLGSGDSGANNSQATLTTSDAAGIDAGTITVTLSTGAPSSKPGSLYVKSITVTYEDAVPTTTVTASPTSITFANNTLDGSGEASGSSTVDLSVTNGNRSGGNYLWVVVESDDAECEFTINSGAYSYGSGNNTSINDLSVEYYAISAGTWDGRVIAQGYNSSYQAVNCTIPLRVTISAPACANQVTLTKGAQTNGTFSLNKSNGSYDNCLSNFVVTVSSISPSAGYACTGVTATGGNSTVTGPDGSGNYTVTYTKGNTISSTVTANFAAKVATPTFSPAAGTYTGAQNVTISCGTADATIYYTTNGSTPTTSSSVYSTPISVTQGTTIKAFATKAGMPNSDVATAAYVIRYTVSWSVNGTSYSSPVVVTAGSTTSTPANPAATGDCAGLVFRGWTATANYEHATDAPGNMFNSTTPPITGDITFHAVFAEEDD